LLLDKEKYERERDMYLREKKEETRRKELNGIEIEVNLDSNDILGEIDYKHDLTNNEQ